MSSEIKRYTSFLRGINVGGHKKVPMVDLKIAMSSLGCENIVTILNSGNIIYDAPYIDVKELDSHIETHLEKVFGFHVPVITCPAEFITQLVDENPFEQVEITKETRLYVSFLKEETDKNLDLPWSTPDESYQIIDIRKNIICSVLDLKINNTPKGMDVLEQMFGKNITTRNWNTLHRICAKV